MLSKFITLFVFYFLSCLPFLKSQDALFTMIESNPMLLNPALTGYSSGDFEMKLGIQSRRQWFDALDDFFNHSSFALEYSSPFCPNWKQQFVFSGGLYFTEERFPIDQGLPELINTKVGATLSGRMMLERGLVLMVGFEGGFIDRNLNGLAGLRFPVQYDGLGGWNSNASNQEVRIPDNGQLNTGPQMDLGAGFALAAELNDWFAFRIGAAIHHFNRANLSLLEEENDATKLAPRHTAHLRIRLGLLKEGPSSQFYFNYLQQGQGIWQSIAGTEFGYRVEDHYLALGGGIKLNNAAVTSDPMTAYFGMIRWKYYRFDIALSLDFASSSFANPTTRSRGSTVELSLGYYWLDAERSNRCKATRCPDF